MVITRIEIEHILIKKNVNLDGYELVINEKTLSEHSID